MKAPGQRALRRRRCQRRDLRGAAAVHDRNTGAPAQRCGHVGDGAIGHADEHQLGGIGHPLGRVHGQATGNRGRQSRGRGVGAACHRSDGEAFLRQALAERAGEPSGADKADAGGRGG